MENKSQVPRMIDNGNTSGNPQVSASGTGPTVGQGVQEYPKDGSGKGNEGPGVGGLTKLNSDDAPVGPSYPR